MTRSRGLATMATSRVALPEPFETFTLEPLSNEASVQLLERKVGASLPHEASDWIHARAAGNPLFTLEFFGFLTRRGFLWSDGSHWHWRVPDRDVLPVTVEAMIERAIHEACPDQTTRGALEARTYLESLAPNLKLEPDVWAHVAGLELNVLELAEQHLWARGVLNETGFVHPLFREVPSKGMNALARQTFARRALEIFPLEVRAVFIEDAQLGPERSLELFKKAAEQSPSPGRWLALAVEFSSGQDRALLALEAARQLTQSDLRLAEKLYRVALENNHDDTVMLEFIDFLATNHPAEIQALFDQLPISIRSSEQGLAVRFQLMVIASNGAALVECWRDELGSSSDINPDVLVHVIFSLKALTRFDEAIQLAGQILSRSDLSPWQRARVLNRQANAYGESNRYTHSLELTNQILELIAGHGLPGRDVILADRAFTRPLA